MILWRCEACGHRIGLNDDEKPGGGLSHSRLYAPPYDDFPDDPADIPMHEGPWVPMADEQPGEQMPLFARAFAGV